MTENYRWPPDIEEALDRTLDSLRREFDTSAFYAAQRHIEESAAQLVSLQLENSAVESVRRYLDGIQQQKLAFEVLEARINSPVADALRDLDVQHAEFRSQIAQTIAPLPDLSAWRSSLIGDFQGLRDVSAVFGSINQAVERASLLWSTPLPAPRSKPRAEKGSEEPPSTPPSEQLVQIVPAEALSRLKSVDLLPLRVLDRIYLSPKAIHQLTPRQFEQLVAEILEELGFQGIELTPRSGDKGRDVVALQRVNGIPILFAFECKRNAPHRKIGVGVVRTLLGTINQASTRADVGVLVTTSTFTQGAQNFFLTEARIKGRDFNGVTEWLEEISRLRDGA